MFTSPHLFIAVSIGIFSYCAYLQAHAQYNVSPSAFRYFTRLLLASYLLLWAMNMLEAIVLPSGRLTRLPLFSLHLFGAILMWLAFCCVRLVMRGLNFMHLVVRRRGGEAPQGPRPTDKKRRPLTR